MKKVTLLLFIALSWMACTNSSAPKNEWKPLNLLEYGAPITIMAPDSAEIKKGTLGQFEDITIHKGNYGVQILAVKALTQDIAEAKGTALNNAKQEDTFARIVKDEENGFIFESKVGETLFYDFRYVTIKAGKEYTFRADWLSQYTLEEAEKIYEAVKQN